MVFDPTHMVSGAPAGGRKRLWRPPFGKLVAFAAVTVAGYALVALVLGSAMHVLGGGR